MFNPRQLLVQAQLLKAVVEVGTYDWQVREYVLGAYQQYLRNQNMFCFWDISRDCLAPHLSNNNYHPKNNVVENCVFPLLGRGNWASCVEGIIEGREWATQPWDSLSNEALKRRDPVLADQLSGKSEKVFPSDPVLDVAVHQGSSTDLAQLENCSLDLVITDPPFGGLLHYSELADFFYVWLRLALKGKYPEIFGAEYTPKSLEAVGREGLNLQFARILFNFDLPWNPMDMEQRIGRIHRYGQNHTAQVYNLVLSDTIEGRIFLLLDEKLTEIARTVGKVDDQGNVAEDLRAQILGQLSERLNYDRLYQEALSDPELKRTQVELEAALSNSREARQVVFDLFQDLDGFSLDDYQPFSDVSSSLDRLVRFLSAAVADRQQKLLKVDEETYDLVTVDGTRRARFTLSRDTATSRDDLELMGLDHPLVQEELGRWRSVTPEDIGIAVAGDVDEPVLLSLWMVEASAGNGERRVVVQPIAVKQDGTRVPTIERQCERYLQASAISPSFTPEQRLALFAHTVEPTLQRELKHKGAANGDGSYSAELIGYVEILKTPA